MRDIYHMIRAQRISAPSGATAFKALLVALAVTVVLAAAAFAQTVQEELDITPTDQITDTSDLELEGARGIAIFTIGERTYAAVAAYYDDGVQILDLTDPANITATDKITDTRNLALNGAAAISTFMIGGRTYAAVAAYYDNGVQILDLTDPANITATDKITDKGSRNLFGARGIAIFTVGERTYAAVAGHKDHGVQILDLTDPANITATDRLADNRNRALYGARGIAPFKIGERTYAAVSGLKESGVQIIDLSDPANITAISRMTDDDVRGLNGPAEIATFTIGERTYAAVAANQDNGVQILDLTDPANPEWSGQISDTPSLALHSATGIATFKVGERTYAAVASWSDDGVQILDLTDPANISASGRITDEGTRELNGAIDVAIFERGEHIYAAVAAHDDNGVQIIRLITAANDAPTADAGTDQTVQDVVADPPQENSVVLEPPAQRGARDIGTITLVSSQAGTIQASWEAPSEAPANYRISWAKVGENFRTWSDPAGNAFPTKPSYTITGLEEGEEYKVKVRASYSGTAGDWSGQVTITVAESPPNDPPANDPPPSNTVVLEPDASRGSRDIGTITLVSAQAGTIQASWEAPSETPTDYRISWAKVAESFLTWNDPAGNAFPTEASYTITGLNGGEAYKVKIRARYNGSSGDWSGQATITVIASPSSKPVTPSLTFGLEANYPNPFNPETQIAYTLSATGPVELAIYNVLGQRIRTLVQDIQAPGRYQVRWNGRNDEGSAVASGIYLSRLSSAQAVQVRRLLLLK